MPQIILDGACIVPVRRQVIATGMPQLMGVRHKGQTSEPPRSCDDLTNGTWRQRRLALRHEDIGRVGVETLELTKQPQLWTPQGMFGVVPTFRPMDIEVPGFEIHLVPSREHWNAMGCSSSASNTTCR
jgi:hypothetical protein